MNNKSYNGSWCIRKIFPMNLKTFKLGSFLISQGILFHRADPL